MPETLEKEIEKKLGDIVKSHGGLCLKWVCPGWSGVPDRILLLPGGHILFVELKRPKGGRRNPMQKWWGKTLEKLGFFHRFAHNDEDLQGLDVYISCLLKGEKQ